MSGQDLILEIDGGSSLDCSCPHRGWAKIQSTPTQLQFHRARAIHNTFARSIHNIPQDIHRKVFEWIGNCPPTITANARAFALLTDWGSVVTRGDFDFGGDKFASSDFSRRTNSAFWTSDNRFAVVTPADVAEQLSTGVKTVFANDAAFAALKVDGSVVTWGLAESGGDSSRVAAQLSNGVHTVYGNPSCFAAVKSDGSVVAWGDWLSGGKISDSDSDSDSDFGQAVQLQSGVQTVVANKWAFAAVKIDGSVVTWGLGQWGGDSSRVAAQLSNGVQTVVGNDMAFAAVKEGGSVVTWGDEDNGGDSSEVAEELSRGVHTVVASGDAFAAVKDDGSVVTWGSPVTTLINDAAAAQLQSGVQTVVGNGGAFAAVKVDGSVVTWGHKDYGGGNPLKEGSSWDPSSNFFSKFFFDNNSQ